MMTRVKREGGRNRAVAYGILTAVFLLPALFFGYVAVSLVQEYGDDGWGSALMFALLGLGALAVSILFALMGRKALRAPRSAAGTDL